MYVVVSQNDRKLFRQTFRTNVNVFVLFLTVKKDLKHSFNMSWNEFKAYAEQIKDHSFLVIIMN